MDFEERINRITERHEALAQTVELLTADVRQQTENVNRLLRIAEIQHERITRLEGGQA